MFKNALNKLAEKLAIRTTTSILGNFTVMVERLNGAIEQLQAAHSRRETAITKARKDFERFEQQQSNDIVELQHEIAQAARLRLNLRKLLS